METFVIFDICAADNNKSRQRLTEREETEAKADSRNTMKVVEQNVIAGELAKKEEG